MTDNLDQLVQEAQAGSQTALEQLVTALQDRVYNLAMRMLVHPEDAQDASQEILILIVTKLSTFRGESAFTTWVYRVATNYLLTAKKNTARFEGLTFDIFAADLADGLVSDPPASAEDVVMLNELRISCTMAMLLCLDLDKRITYVLGDILELEHSDAAEILGITKDNYRKKLSRARAEVVAFTSNNCGLANNEAKCSCPKRLPAAISQNRIHAGTYSTPQSTAYDDVLTQVKQLEGDLKVLKLQNAITNFKSPQDFGAHIAQIVQGPS